VHVCDVNPDAVERVTRDNPAITATVCDISDRDAVERFVDEAVDSLGGIDVLVNNAGIAGPTTSVENLDPDEWDTVLAVNLTGPFNVTRLAIPHLKNSDTGVIIMMSSVGGRFGYANRSTYATTKRALIALAETLALELGDHGIRVNTIAPGAVSGPRMDGVLRARAAATGRNLELKS
jgi:NAD(P)-dependent dehydrogenase (short-subunit alcohol dehydrogenase family)